MIGAGRSMISSLCGAQHVCSGRNIITKAPIRVFHLPFSRPVKFLFAVFFVFVFCLIVGVRFSLLFVYSGKTSDLSLTDMARCHGGPVEKQALGGPDISLAY